jgi:hypothetical protein
MVPNILTSLPSAILSFWLEVFNLVCIFWGNFLKILLCRTLIDHDGRFFTVDICQIPLYYLLNTGSTMSVLHSNIFKKLPQKMQTRLKTSNQKLRMAEAIISSRVTVSGFEVSIFSHSTLFDPWYSVGPAFSCCIL